jgi:hypothetical protein
MAKYKIMHRDGEFVADLQSDNQKHFANISANDPAVNITLSGKDEDEVYYNCRCWASDNIRGEFAFEKIG